MSIDKTSQIYEAKYKDKVNNLLEIGGVSRHSLFQLKYFIIGKEPTHQSKMWRCLSEIESRNEQLENIILEQEELIDKIKLLDIDKIRLLNLSMPENNVEKEELLIRARMNDRKKNGLLKSQVKLDKKAAEIQQEIIFFTEAYYSLEKIEELKPFDDVNAQTEYWNEKISQDLNLRMLLGKPLDIEMVKTALALNEKVAVKQELLNLLDNSKKLTMEKNGR